MAHSLKLLLTENVENTGIVGDVVVVRKGYARNFLLPRGLATVPSDALIKQLQGKRADALKQLDTLRSERPTPIRLIELADDFRVLNRLEYMMVVVSQLRKRLSQAAGKIQNG